MGLRSICDVAVVERPVDNGSVPFYNDTECASIYFLIFGRFAYFPTGSDAEHQERHASGTELETGAFLCEPAIWCKWRHRGLLQASSAGLLLVLSTKSFHQIVSEHPAAHTFCCEFASVFMQKMTDHVEPIDDLFHPVEFTDDVMSCTVSTTPTSS